MSDDPLYRIAREVTDEVMGAGAYAEINRGHPDPRIREEVRLSASRVYYNQFTKCVCGHDFGHHDQSQPSDPEEPHQCRLCECEAFMTKGQAKAFADDS